MGKGRMLTRVLTRCWLLVGGVVVLLLSAEIMDAFAVGSTSATIDLDTTLPLTTDSFWRYAHSQDFYRRTRQHSRIVRQEVVRLSNWVQSNDMVSTNCQSDPAAVGTGSVVAVTCPGNNAAVPPFPGHDRQQGQEEKGEEENEEKKEEQQSQPPRPRSSWCRTAELNYAISSPFGSSNAKVVQEHTLLEEQESGGIRYSERNRITGFPMVPGDVCVKTTFLVTPAEDDGEPGRIRVQIGVVVQEIGLPKRLGFLNRRIGKMIGKRGSQQAEQWLGEMIKADPLVTAEAPVCTGESATTLTSL